MRDVQFARGGDVYVAYRVVGDGPIDLVCVEGACSHLEITWELPAYRRCYERIGEFARVILFDKRGPGMSDRVTAELKGVPGEWRLYAVARLSAR